MSFVDSEVQSSAQPPAKQTAGQIEKETVPFWHSFIQEVKNPSIINSVNRDNPVKSRILPFFWIPAFAGMTIIQLISDRYNRRHTREGGYPVFKTTFCDSINRELKRKSLADSTI
jgi:hypothetical protein